MNIEKINNVSVKPVLTGQDFEDPNKIVGADLFTTLYSNIFLCAKKKVEKAMSYTKF